MRPNGCQRHTDFNTDIDKLNHLKAIAELDRFGFKGCLLQWLLSYLNYRRWSSSMTLIDMMIDWPILSYTDDVQFYCGFDQFKTVTTFNANWMSLLIEAFWTEW